MAQTITYEQPLNEVIRVCLRLEQLFQQIDYQLTDLSLLGTRNVIALIISTLHILDRPDLKSKLAKELSHHMANLMRFASAADVNMAALHELTQQLDELSRQLIDSSGKIGGRLRDIELLNTLRLHLASPGGGCSFDLPLYHYWLNLPKEDHEKVIHAWLSDFAQIRQAVTLVLDLVRKNAKVEQKTAVHGFHQELLDPQSNLRMIQISIPNDTASFPEISVGRHFLSVRFFNPNIDSRPTQYTENLDFTLTYCN